MKRYLAGISLSAGILFGTVSVTCAQTTTGRGAPTISGFAPNAVSGHAAQPVTGFTPAPVQGLTPQSRVAPISTNFTTGPIAPLSTGVAGTGENPQFVPPVPPPPVVTPLRTNNVAPNAVGTPLF